MEKKELENHKIIGLVSMDLKPLTNASKDVLYLYGGNTCKLAECI